MLSHTSASFVRCASLENRFIPSNHTLFVPSPCNYAHRRETEQRSAPPAGVTYPLTTNPVAINNHCSLTHFATLQRSGIRNITILRLSAQTSGMCVLFRQRHKISRYTRNGLPFTLISTAFFAPIFTTFEILNSIT